MKLTRRAVLTGGVAALLPAQSLFAEAPDRSLRPLPRPEGFHRTAVANAETLIANSGLSGRVVFQVADTRTGRVLEGHDADAAVPPASVAKAVTALYALDVLGSEHRFLTRLMATRSVQNGVLNGDLVLVGGGDPTLSTDAMAGLAEQLKASGLREVRGDFLVYEGMLPLIDTIDPGQPDHVGYSPAVSGIALNYNRVHFEWRRSSGRYQVTMDARSERYRPDVNMARMRIADRTTPVYSYRDQQGVDDWSVARGALGGGGARWLPVRKPGLYAGDVMRTMARAQGISLPTAKLTRQSPQGPVLATHASPRLQIILRDMLKYSTNLTAEMTGMAASAARGRQPGSLRASAQEMNRWAVSHLGMRRLRLVDHSGLGDASRMRAGDMVEALVQVHSRQGLRPILKAIAMRDANRNVIRDHPIEVHAKTGTLNFVSGFAGYMTAPDGTELAFAIFAADEEARARISRAQRERPDGAQRWNRRAKALQQKLIERWGTVYGS